MKAILALSALFSVLVCLSSPAADTLAKASGISPSGNISWSVNPGNGDLNLIRADGSGSLTKLCDTFNVANLGVHFSPDDKYILVTDGGSSLGIHGTLYQKSSGLDYKAVDFDFDYPIEKLAIQSETGKEFKESVLDHTYLKCLGWSRDSQWVFLQFSGKGSVNGKAVRIEGFKCAYNPKKGELTNNMRVAR